MRTKWVNQLLQKDYIGVREMQFCSQIVRKTKKKELHFWCNSLIFNVDQPGLEPGTSRLWVCCSNQLSYKSKNWECKSTLKKWEIQTFLQKSTICVNCLMIGLRNWRLWLSGYSGCLAYFFCYVIVSLVWVRRKSYVISLLFSMISIFIDGCFGSCFWSKNHWFLAKKVNSEKHLTKTLKTVN